MFLVIYFCYFLRKKNEEENHTLKGLLGDFLHDVFQEPKELSPTRALDHTIPLKPYSKHVNIKPYRYPYFQNAEIGKLVKDMMQSSFIQPSHSPFASPIFIMKKKDGTWRFCIDYRALNDITIKDKFPIHLVEDLMVELNGLRCSIRWICVQAITKSEWQRRMFIKLLLGHTNTP